MLLAIDIGNTTISCGIYAGAERAADFRLLSDTKRPADEYAALLSASMMSQGVMSSAITSVAISSVVPLLTQTISRFCLKRLALKPLIVTGGTETGLKSRYSPPEALGADRLMNAFGAHRLYGEQGNKHCLVVDLGTATKFEAVTAEGDYLGGAILPGVGISLDALFSHAALLSRVDLTTIPQDAIGTNTADALRSGILFGYADLIDGMVGRLWTEMVAELADGADDESVRIIATGGYASLIAPHCSTIDTVDELLTLNGLRLLHEELTQASKGEAPE